ncbi:hypothetical protein [Candidatus Marinarcus aquaticus]|uniref:Uncharacterized protein n=1 Tax=Candidatus Marinarcus aquaticus TaxID=2044504 RepID=A0A4Q0XQE3_9BACT|nr:hypothetical protein [Candidatus Marinarcus aquaticus]RXJ56279.1 hypothetical protein CRV04_09555 [Candidatus Marinarcus aquaticus]
MDIEIKVLLLGILKKESDENLNDVLAKLEEAKVFSFKEGKKLLKMLKSEGYLTQNKLTVKGELKAKEVEKEFKI